MRNMESRSSPQDSAQSPEKEELYSSEIAPEEMSGISDKVIGESTANQPELSVDNSVNSCAGMIPKEDSALKNDPPDLAVAGPSNENCMGLHETNTSSQKDLNSRKRERCEEDGSDSEEYKRCSDHRTNCGTEEERENTVSRNRNPESSLFPRLREKACHRRYRRRLNDRSSSSSSSSSSSVSSFYRRPNEPSSPGSVPGLSRDSDDSDSDGIPGNILLAEGQSEPSSPSSPSSALGLSGDSDNSDSDGPIPDRVLELIRQAFLRRGVPLDSDDTSSHLDSDDSDSDAGESRVERGETEEDEKYTKCLSKEVPKHRWNVTQSILKRQLGMRTQQQEPVLFWQRCYGSLHCVKRLELMYKLEKHLSCVNAISFNQSGTRLASGSDDRKIVVWDWAFGKNLITYSSGHSNNVYQVKFLPFKNDTHIVSSSLDGQVRLAVLSSSGQCHATRRLLNHGKAINKLALVPETPNVFFSAGEDGRVMSIDIRVKRESPLMTVREGLKTVVLYSVDIHPLNSNQICVSGMDPYIRLYDIRNMVDGASPMKRFCPSHIVGSSQQTSVTCALYNHDGSEVIGSYQDESLYLFDTSLSDGADYVHKYEGHRNNLTVKGCGFFGPKSEYIMSGSDCGNIFFWDKNTEAIVQLMRGDEKGVVNGLEGHPQFPILATCGLDSDVKIWVPSCEQDPEMKDLKKVVGKNIRLRLTNEPFDVWPFEHFSFVNRILALSQDL